MEGNITNNFTGFGETSRSVLNGYDDEEMEDVYFGCDYRSSSLSSSETDDSIRLNHKKSTQKNLFYDPESSNDTSSSHFETEEEETNQPQIYPESEYDEASQAEWIKISRQLDLDIDNKFETFSSTWTFDFDNERQELNQDEEMGSDSPVESPNDAGSKKLLLKAVKPKLFPCTTCYQIFPYEFMLMNHAESHDTTFACSIKQCQKKFSSSASLKYHLKAHDDMNRSFVCDNCEMRFSTATSLKSHYSRDHKLLKLVGIFSCGICQKQFRSTESLKLHIETHESKLSSVSSTIIDLTIDDEKTDRKFACKECSVSFNEAKNLVRHYKVAHPVSRHRKEFGTDWMSKLECPICRKKSASQSDHAKHIRRHSKTDLLALINKSISKVVIPKVTINSDEIYEISDDEPEALSDKPIGRSITQSQGVE